MSPIEKVDAAIAAQHEFEVESGGIGMDDFYAHLPTHSYIYVPTGELWPAASINGHIKPWPEVAGKAIKPSALLDQHRCVVQLTWHPGEPQIIRNRVMQASGFAARDGDAVFNLYRPPERFEGDPSKAGPWLEHLHQLYPEDAPHILCWLAQRIQQPGVKINHALVLGGGQGIGKDTALVPIRTGVGPWNVQEVGPQQMLGRFNGYVRAVLIVCNEARDLGHTERAAFYDHCKSLVAAPPDVLRVDEKNLREYYVANVSGVIMTTNHKSGGIYLPADDRRHYVAWSEVTRDSFSTDYWRDLYRWYESGGIGHVIAYLKHVDLKHFDPKAPPERTPAFWSIVHADETPEAGELRDVLEFLGDPPAITVEHLSRTAANMRFVGLAEELRDRKCRRGMPHKLERVGYVPVRNPDATDGLFKIQGKRQAVYATKTLDRAKQLFAARHVGEVGEVGEEAPHPSRAQLPEPPRSK